MKALVPGGSGFAGRHVVAALIARGHSVVVGTRGVRWRGIGSGSEAVPRVRARFETLTNAAAWEPVLDGIVNCVGVLRERGRETYDRVHHLAPAALAAACRSRRIRRLVHISALGLTDAARSRFIRSKLDGERAILRSGATATIVRPSLLDGEGGFGARWLRSIARWPIHVVPADATGRIAVLQAGDLGAAVAAICEAESAPPILGLGGTRNMTLAQHLAALRAASGRAPARCIRVAPLLARLGSHVCDLLHFSPFSFGHLELLRHDNVPSRGALDHPLAAAAELVPLCSCEGELEMDANYRDAVASPTLSGDQPPPSDRARSTSAIRASRAAAIRSVSACRSWRCESRTSR